MRRAIRLARRSLLKNDLGRERPDRPAGTDVVAGGHGIPAMCLELDEPVLGNTARVLMLACIGNHGAPGELNPDRAAAATFQSLPGASFVVNGARQGADATLTTVSVEKIWLNG